jgi:hypothetical protein
LNGEDGEIKQLMIEWTYNLDAENKKVIQNFVGEISLTLALWKTVKEE